MTNIDPHYEIVDDSIKAVLYAIGNTLKNLMPPGWGFSLFIVEIGDKGSTFYLSSLERETFLTALEEFIKRERSATPPKRVSEGKLKGHQVGCASLYPGTTHSGEVSYRQCDCGFYARPAVEPREESKHVNDNPAPTGEATNLGDERRD